MINPLAIASDIIGWIYVLCWSGSFYPQAMMNYSRKRVDGFSIDFATLNVISFGCYAFYTTSFTWNEQIRQEYRQRHDGEDSSVMLNDVAFSVHAFLLSSITLAQTYYYPRAEGQKLSPWNRGVVTAFFVLVAADYLLVGMGVQEPIDFLYHLSYFKLYVTFAKYVPQAYMNYNRKSTAGFSIENMILDLTGGMLSLLQSLLIAHLDNNWTSITGNPVKTGLSMLSLCFPTLFIVQHFILYRHARDKQIDFPHRQSETTPLLV